MGVEPENPEGNEGFAGLVGIEYLEHTHGGVHATIAETICSYATAIGVGAEGKIAMGMSNSTTFLRPISDGHVNAAARTRHRGRTTWVWDVEITDDQDRLCALVRMTVAVRDPQPR
jgi:1,4-dihydroxy-2-naphthoyl-CoA hydrolase